MKFDSIQPFFFFSLLIGTTVIFFWVLGPYLMPIFWAIVIAVVSYPLYLRISEAINGRPSLASILAILALVLTVLLPLLLLGGMIVKESVSLYQSFTSESGKIDGLNMLDRSEEFVAYLEPYGISQQAVTDRLRGWATDLSQVVASSLLTFGQITFSLLVSTAVMLYLLFFFFRDGEKLQQTLIYYLPLGDANEKFLFKRFSETARAVIKGTIAIALLQGILGAMTFTIVGLSNPVLWGVAMAAGALIPAIGPALVWLPVSIILLATGSIWQGVVIILSGVLVIGLVDNLLRPILVGRGAKMPDSITLLATIGGLATFGVSGLVVGPIIAAFFLSLWTMFGERYQKDLAKN